MPPVGRAVLCMASFCVHAPEREPISLLFPTAASRLRSGSAQHMKTNCKRCRAEILTTTSESNCGMCDPCFRTTREIAWRRSRSFIWVCLMLPAALIAFVFWRMFQQEWKWGWGLLVLFPLLIRNIKLRTSEERLGC